MSVHWIAAMLNSGVYPLFTASNMACLWELREKWTAFLCSAIISTRVVCKLTQTRGAARQLHVCGSAELPLCGLWWHIQPQLLFLCHPSCLPPTHTQRRCLGWLSWSPPSVTLLPQIICLCYCFIRLVL